MSGHVEAAVTDQVLQLTITNPDRANALTPDMLRALTDGVAAGAADPDVRVIVLRGANGTFSSGYALDSFPEPDDLQEVDELTQAGEAVAACPKPTISVLEGAAVGAALDLAVATDFRLAATTLRAGITPARFGIVYPWQGIARLADRLGRQTARRLLLTGEIVGADLARELGVVDEVAAPDALDQLQQRWTDRLRDVAPLSVSGTKLVLEALTRGGDAVAGDPALREAILRRRRDALGSIDAAEARAAFGEKRRPTFIGR